MKYILNEGRYAHSFIIEKANGNLKREVKIELDRRRRYTDTGNIATTGITAIEDEDFELLQKNGAFAQLVVLTREQVNLQKRTKSSRNSLHRLRSSLKETKTLRLYRQLRTKTLSSKLSLSP